MPADKVCPQCGTKHTKRGPYCSRSCGNVRVHTEEDKNARRIAAKKYYETPEGLATAQKSSRMATIKNQGLQWDEVGAEDFAVDIPDLPDMDVLDRYNGWDKSDNW
jgi:hypothetical protein